MRSAPRASRVRRPRLQVEGLEARQLLAGFQPTAAEQLFLQELNEARANPAAYGASIGIDLSAVPPAQPLAFNPLLIEAAQLHSQDMNARGYFGHDTPEGIDPGQRMLAAGFVWDSWGESLAAGAAYPGPADALGALITDAGVPDLGHRRQLLAIDAMFQNQNQVGIGIVQGGSGPLTNYYTIDTAGTWGNPVFLTGVVYQDANHNGKYDLGEGLGGVTVSVAGVGAVTTWSTGGYTIPVGPGTYVVTASGGGLAAPLTTIVTVGSANVEVDFSPEQYAYVQQLYQTILGRTAAPSEITPWVTALEGPAGPQGVAWAIEHSPEARTRLVRSWYVTYLGRQAQGGEEQGWVAWMLAGATEEDTLAGILSSPEYLHRVGAQASATGTAAYIDLLYTVLLHRTPSAAELNSWLPSLTVAGPEIVALGFLTSQEYRSEVIGSYYTSLLQRPTPPAPTEIAAWADTSWDLTTIRVAFESSLEFLLLA